MAINYTDRYVDPVDGNDANSGVIGAPWQTLQHAINNVDYDACRLNLSNKAEFDLAGTALTIPVARAYTRPVLVRVWDNGGETGLTETYLTGEDAPVFVINGRVGAGTLPGNICNTGNLSHWHFRQGHFKRASNFLFYNPPYTSWVDCFFSEGGAASYSCLNGGSETYIERCKFTNSASGAISNARGTIKSCVVEDCGNYQISVLDWSNVTNCICKNPVAGRSSIYTGNKRGIAILNNTLIETNGATGSYGINVSAGSYNAIVKNNLCVGFSGSGSTGIYLAGYLNEVGHNAFYITGSGVNYQTTPNHVDDHTSEDVVLTSNPFVDGSSVAPYKLDPESDAFGTLVGAQPYDDPMSYGANQKVDDGGGGGGGGNQYDPNAPLAWNDGVPV